MNTDAFDDSTLMMSDPTLGTWIVNPETDCWEWFQYIKPVGYGSIFRKGKAHSAHRWVYAHLVE